MPTVVRSIFAAGVALAGAATVALNPVTPAIAAHAGAQLPALQTSEIALTGFTVPAVGAIPYQILINQFADFLALAPIVLGSTQQCTACLGPTSPPSPYAVPFSGWGGVGVTVGVFTSPVAFFDSLKATGNFMKALGAASLAIQTPITNTFRLIQADREPLGGFALQATLDRALTALTHTVDYTLQVATQALIDAPLALVAASVAGVQAFGNTLATTGDLIAALSAGIAPVQAAVQGSIAAVVNTIQTERATVYADLTSGPAKATRPIPVVSPPTAAVAAPPAAATAPAIVKPNHAPSERNPAPAAGVRAGATAKASASHTVSGTRRA